MTGVMIYKKCSAETYNPGDHVKAEFAGASSSESEWMCVEVSSSDNEHRILFGKLDSQSIVHTEVRAGQQLAVRYDKIRDHRRLEQE